MDLPKLKGETFQQRKFREFWNGLSEKDQNWLAHWAAEVEARGLDFADHLRSRFKEVYGIDV